MSGANVMWIHIFFTLFFFSSLSLSLEQVHDFSLNFVYLLYKKCWRLFLYEYQAYLLNTCFYSNLNFNLKTLQFS